MPGSNLPAATPPPFSRPFAVERLRRDAPEIVAIEADEAERLALAGIDGLVSVGRLSARFEIRREAETGVRLSGAIEADVVQTCIVSLDPFPATISETVRMHFLPRAEAEAAQAAALGEADDDIAAFADADEIPDPIVDGMIDLGAITAEFLALGLDPYPRKPGATFEPVVAGNEDADASPFVVLQSLKDGKTKP